MAALVAQKRRRPSPSATSAATPVVVAVAALLLARTAGATSPSPSPPARAITVDFVAPKPGSTDAVVGRVSGLDPARNASEFKLMLLISNDTVVWYDKTGTPYIYLAPGAGNAGVVLSADWSWRAFPWAHPDQLLHDSMKPYMRAYLLPSTYDLLAPSAVVEGVPIPPALSNAAFAYASVNRYTGEVTRDTPGELGRSSGTPAPSLTATPSWTRPPDGVSAACRCAPRLTASGGSGGSGGVVGPIAFLGTSRRGDANAVAVGAALTLGLGLLGPADPSCPQRVAELGDVLIARATLRIVGGYSGPAEDGLYVRAGSGAALAATGTALSYLGGHRQRLLLAPSDADGSPSLPLPAFLRALSLVVYRNEFAGTPWQTDGARTFEIVFYDAGECTSTALRQDVRVLSSAGGSSSGGGGGGVPAACFDNLNATYGSGAAASGADGVALCAQSAGASSGARGRAGVGAAAAVIVGVAAALTAAGLV